MLKRTSTLTRKQRTTDEEKSASEKRVDQLEEWRKRETEEGKAEPEPRKSDKPRKSLSFDLATLLLASTAEGDIEEVKRLLQKGANVNAANVEGLAPIHEAVAQENLEMIDFLLSNGADINIQDNEGWTPLHAVCQYGFAEVAEHLLKRGANPKITNLDNELPLDLIEDEEFEDLVAGIMEEQGITEEIAEELRNAELNRMLKDIEEMGKTDPGSVNHQSEDGTSLLHIACGKGYLAAVLTLLDKGANPNLQDRDGWSPLHVAAYWGKTLVLEPLLTFGGDIDVVNNDNETPLDVADSIETREKLEALREKFSKGKKPLGVVRRNSSALRRGHLREKRALQRHAEEGEFPNSP